MTRHARSFLRRRVGLTRTGWWVALFVLLALLGGLSAGLARAQTGPEEGERYSPSSRGPRASYGTVYVQQWRPFVDAYDWPVETALRVIACESQGNPEAVNPRSGAAGLFQLYQWRRLALRLTGSGDVLDAWVNIRTAYALWADTGTFSWHWYASIGCWGW